MWKKNGEMCGCGCHKMMGIYVILFGVVFLLGALDMLSRHTVDIAWPSIVILAGLTKMCSHLCKCCAKSEVPPHTH